MDELFSIPRGAGHYKPFPIPNGRQPFVVCTLGGGSLQGTLISVDEGNKKESRPVSRVLSRAIIPLRHTSPHAFSNLPGSLCGPHLG